MTARTAQPVDELAVNISVGTTTYSVSTKPNRNYTVEVSAMTCRGYGPVTNANQNCESDVEGQLKLFILYSHWTGFSHYVLT